MIREYFERRRQRKFDKKVQRNTNKYVRGYNWAAGELLRWGIKDYSEALVNTQAYCDTARTTGEYDSFDAGAEEAIADYTKALRLIGLI